MEHTSQLRLVVGVMTGTSIDGIDAALVQIDGEALAMSAALARHLSRSLGPLAKRLRLAAEQQPMTAGDFATLALDFGQLHADAIDDLLERAGLRDGLSLICVHGQTVFHRPPISWQLINPAPIAARFPCPIVSDLRQADLACGGQGAPITPIADWIMFRSADKRRAIINLGGFCNATILPRDGGEQAMHDIRGFDVCACNQALDAVARSALGVPFDRDGAAARRGKANPRAVDSLFEMLVAQRRANRSLGTGDEAVRWIEQQPKRIGPDDLAATAASAIGRCIGSAVAEHDVDELIVAGGGAKHRFLVECIGAAAKKPVVSSAKLGVPIEAREAMAFAILGCLSADGVPITLPQVTGCQVPGPLAGSMMHFKNHG